MPNALIGERSPYLLQHADNPVDWRPWSDEVFRLAREQDKLVFLSIGYSTCHWCHVMAHESFEDEGIAEIMNHHFLNLKLDREEYPEIDALYMHYLQATTGQGGWPMSIWLDGTGRPVYGGTYFPARDKHGRAGFPRVCQELARLWRDDRATLLQHADKVMEHLQQQPTLDGEPPEPSQLCDDFLQSCQRRFDQELGGFGGAPKFPRPAVLDALMALVRRQSPESPSTTGAWAMIEATLRAMADGGIHDQLGGGFHRYSVDRHWHVPHYEKMLYDQGQLALTYLGGWELSGDERLLRVATGILDYLTGNMLDGCGAFHAAEDADSLEGPGSDHAIEGAFWTWRAEDIGQHLEPRDAAIFCEAFGVEAGGNARPESDPHQELQGRNTLYRARTAEQLAVSFDCTPEDIRKSLDASRAILLEARSQRPLPHRDDKIITAWNGLAIAALARAGRLLHRADWSARASAAARFLLQECMQDGELRRCWRGLVSPAPAIADDYVFLIHGLLELADSEPDADWLDYAVQLQEKLDQRLWDEAWKGYVMRPRLEGRVLMTLRNDYDGAEPSPNHLALLNLRRLATLTGCDTYRQQADRLQGAACRRIETPFAAPVLISALAAQG